MRAKSLALCANSFPRVPANVSPSHSLAGDLPEKEMRHEIGREAFTAKAREVSRAL